MDRVADRDPGGGTDAAATVIAGWSKSVEVPPELEVGARVPLEGESVSALVFRSGQPARIESYENTRGPLSEPLQGAGVRCAVGLPIVVEGHLWGALAAGSMNPEPLPPGVELRLAQSTELAATAIANTENRAELARLADEQAAIIGRLEPDGKVAVVAVSGAGAVANESVLGIRVDLEDMPVTAAALQTGRSARKDDYGDVLTRNQTVRDLGIRSGVGVPIARRRGTVGGSGSGPSASASRRTPSSAWRSSRRSPQPRLRIRSTAPSSRHPAPGSSPPRTRRAAGSSVTSTTGRSSG